MLAIIFAKTLYIHPTSDIRSKFVYPVEVYKLKNSRNENTI